MRNVTIVLALLGLALASCGGGADGTYVIDKDALRASVKEQVSKQIGGAALPAAAEQRVEAAVSSANMELVLASDGTFSAKGVFGGKKMDAQGTWKLDGTTLTMTTTHENGKERTNPEQGKATFENGRIEITEGTPFPIVLKRK